MSAFLITKALHQQLFMLVDIPQERRQLAGGYSHAILGILTHLLQ
jgi:hypothetical protein